jgi:hypothetical protein
VVEQILRRWVPVAAALGLALASGFFWGRRSSAQTDFHPAATALGNRATATIPPDLDPRLLPRLAAPNPQLQPAPSAATADASATLADEPDPEPPLTAEQERQQQLTKLRQSGRDERNLLGTVLTTFGDWRQKLQEQKIDVKLGQWSCFRAGCFMDAVHPSLMNVSEATAAITTTDSFLRWNSSKMRSGEITRPDGTVEVTWLLFAPPEGEPVLQPARITQ